MGAGAGAGAGRAPRQSSSWPALHLMALQIQLQGSVDVLAFIPDQAQAGLDGKSAADGALRWLVVVPGLPSSGSTAGVPCPPNTCAGDPDVWDRGLAAGVLAPIRLTARLAPAMAQRRRGAILAAVWVRRGGLALL